MRWSDISLYQELKLLPDGKEQTDFQRICIACHGFQSRMAAVQRDDAGWHDRVSYMRNTMFTPLLHMSAERGHDVANDLRSMFGPDSILPKSPASMPRIQGPATALPAMRP